MKQFPASNGTMDEKKSEECLSRREKCIFQSNKKENIEKKAKLLKNGVDIRNKPDRYP
ncbi:hypothetical protein HF330_03395 [Bacillus pumilus]|jgi:hypothetical protein|nr:hypothetical protein [Bacillus pumilus]